MNREKSVKSVIRKIKPLVNESWGNLKKEKEKKKKKNSLLV